MGLPLPVHQNSVEEFLALEHQSDVKHEYVDGYVTAMVGASKQHNIIAGNLYNTLRHHLRGTSCMTYMSDMKVLIAKEQNTSIYYPDVVVSCDEDKGESYLLRKPKLIIEVLSESTASKDRLEKLAAYRRLDSLQEYVLVAQDRMHVEVYRREGAGLVLQHFSEHDNVAFSSVNLELPMASIYENIW